MWIRILKHELRLVRVDRAATLAVVLFAAVALFALLAGTAEADRQRGAAAALLAEHAATLEQLQADARAEEERLAADGTLDEEPTWGPRHPFRIGTSVGQPVARPPAPLAAFAVGQSDLLPAAYRVTAGSRTALATADGLENPLRLLAGHLDLAFVILYLFPLLILALSYSVLAEERENGTLRLLLAQPVTAGRLVAGKIAARGLLLLGMAIALLGAAYLLAAPGEGSVPRFALWLVATLHYGAFWFALAIAVNALGYRAATNAVVLASAWLVFVVVVPSTLNALAATLYPVPSRVEFVTAIRAEQAGTLREDTATLRGFYQDHPEVAPGGEGESNYFAMFVARDDRVARRLEPVFARYEAQLDRQYALISRLGYLSPLVLMQGVLLDLAGTGSERHRNFRGQVDDFRDEWQRHFVPLYFANAAFAAVDYDRIPRFAFREEEPGAPARRAALPLGVLLGVTLLLGGWGLARYGRFDVAG